MYRDSIILSITILFLLILAIGLNSYHPNNITGKVVLTNYTSGGCSDTDDDGRVSLRDLNEIQSKISVSIISPQYDPQMDFDKNEIIDQNDVVCLQKDFGRSISCPNDIKQCGCLQGCLDLNNDLEVSVLDLVVLNKLSGTCIDDPKYDPTADFDGDGCINSHQLSQDYLCLKNNFGKKTYCSYSKYQGGCPDYNNDREVNQKDFEQIFKSRGISSKDKDFDPRKDFNDDDKIDDRDLSCFEEFEGTNLKCPDNTKYCGCFNGCPDLDGDTLITSKDIKIFNDKSDLCKSDPNYVEAADFDQDNCIELSSEELDYNCMTYNLGRSMYCNVKTEKNPLTISDINNVEIKTTKKSKSKLEIFSFNDELLGIFDFNNGIYYDKVKLTQPKGIYFYLTGDAPQIKNGIAIIRSQEKIYEIFLGKIEKLPATIFIDFEGNSYTDPYLKDILANELTRYINPEEQIYYSGQSKCTEIQCTILTGFKTYYSYVTLLILALIIIHIVKKKKHL